MYHEGILVGCLAIYKAGTMHESIAVAVAHCRISQDILKGNDLLSHSLMEQQAPLPGLGLHNHCQINPCHCIRLQAEWMGPGACHLLWRRDRLRHHGLVQATLFIYHKIHVIAK